MNFMLKKQALACAVLCLGTAAATAAKLDATPPVITGFTVTPPADVADSLSQVQIEARITDDLSGVSQVQFQLTGPHGQKHFAYNNYNIAPSRTYTARVVVNTNAYFEPGTWTLDYAYIMDQTGNWAYYDPSTLAALGNASFQLANSRRHEVDFTAPVLKQGTVVTPTLSASGTQKGTSQTPLVEANFTVTDDRSGVLSVIAQWCTSGFSSCILTVGGEEARGRLKETLHTASATNDGAAPGVYFLYDLDVTDQAGNSKLYFGADFGGETDFSTLMPGGHTITVTP